MYWVWRQYYELIHEHDLHLTSQADSMAGKPIHSCSTQAFSLGKQQIGKVYFAVTKLKEEFQIKMTRFQQKEFSCSCTVQSQFIWVISFTSHIEI